MTDTTGKICLWFQSDAEAAARFYAETFPNSSVGRVHRAPADNPSAKQGDPLTVDFTVMGIRCMALNGGTHFKQSEAFAFVVVTEDQEEKDVYWNAIVCNAGQESMCGGGKNTGGGSWQITPSILAEAMNGEPGRAKRMFEAMMTMKKIDIAALEAAAQAAPAEV